MDFLKAVNIIGRDLEEAMAMLEQLSGVAGTDKAEVELARSRVRSAADLVKLLPTIIASNAGKADEAPGRSGASAKPENKKENQAEPEHKKEIHTETEQIRTLRAEAGPEAEEMHEISLEVTENEWNSMKKTDTAGSGPVKNEPAGSGRAKTETAGSGRVKAEAAGSGQPKAGTVQPAPAKEEPRNLETSKTILADLFTAEGTIGEKISSGLKEEDISSVIKSKPIADIASAIGINDRFYFIRELFSGDALAYGDTIKRLDAAASLGEAMKILDQSTVMGSDPAAQSSFVDVVRRKFSLNV